MTLLTDNATTAEYHESLQSSVVPIRQTAVGKRSEIVAVSQATRRQSRGWWAWIAMGLLAAGAAVYAQPWKWLRSSSVAVASQPAAARARTVQVVQPQQAVAGNVVLPATIRPWQTAELHARVSGYLARWSKDLGSSVKAGELLAVIETPELDQELLEAQSLNREAAAATAQAKAERQEAEAELKATEAQLVRARAEAELAVSQVMRRKQILATQAITQEEYDTFEKQLVARQSDVAAAAAEVARRRSNLTTRDAVIEVRTATAKSREANVARLKQLQSFQRIVAPFDGVVVRRNAEVGMLVTAGKEPLFTLDDMSRVRVQVAVPQAFATQTMPGAMASVSVPESNASAVSATVTRVAQSVDASNRTMLAEIELDNKEHRLQPGSYVQVALITSQDHANWTIPSNALQMRVDGPHVALVNDRHLVEIKPVRLGRDLGRRIVVVDGIRGQEKLIVNPGNELRSGEEVRVAARDKHSQVAQHGAPINSHE